MKKSFYILTIFFLHILIGSCTDDALYETQDSGTTSLKIVLNVPVDNGRTRGLIYGPDENPYAEQESTISNARILAFNKNNHRYLGQFVSFTSGENTLIANINIKEVGTNELNIVVLTNLLEQENGNELIKTIESWEKNSITKEQALKALKYSFSQKWDLSTRLIPMWGETNITPIEKQTVTGNVDLYRAVSKINVVINDGKGKQTTDGKDVFKLKSVRVYYARTSGLAGSLHAPVANNEGSNTIITPSIPEDVKYFPRYNDSGISSLVYESDQKGGSYAIENQIYVPESDQQNTEEPMCLIVGGYYMGSSEETFYRVDFKQGNKGSVFYNAIRNHIYNFNITNVTRPGTEEPDPALDHVVVGMDVTIKDWTTEWMRGIGGQYTLEVEASGLILESTNTSKNDFWVKSTHNNGWNISEQSGDWFTVNKKADGSGVTITTKGQNKGGQRRGSFVITSGNLNKVIMVRQKGKGTANCYIVSDDGTHMLQDLIVTVKGNGEEGLISDGKPLNDQNPYISPTDVKVIWETAEGLVTIIKNSDGKAKISDDGIIQYKIDLSKKNTNIENSNQNIRGGNALIGAFDGNELIWSWHLWICPDMDQDGKGVIEDTETYSEIKLEEWSTGYSFMDRNLGALSNKPGLASLGLLYQWGRKDPFIGVGKITEEAERMYTKNLSGYDWKSQGSMSVEDARKSPTTLSGSKLEGTDYALLWGTDKGFSANGERDAGNKTIYDPCPVGYRVPPVGSVVFKSGNSSSESKNWDANNIYWPYLNSISDNGYENYKKNADSYGFWVNLEDGNKKPQGLHYYNDNKNNAESISGATWLPISGVYDGNMNSFAKIDKQWSTTVNSIMWTNSSITVGGNDPNRPGALFLHGTEDWNLSHNSSGSGRHIHKLIESGSGNGLYAKSSHAGSVRCIKDSKSSIKNSIKVPETITLKGNTGSTATATLVSITESWEVIDPGASWFTMTPDEGGTGSAQTITFTAAEDNNTGANRSATLKIKFSDGTIKDIVVTQTKKVAAKTVEMTFAGDDDVWNSKSQDIGTKKYSFEYYPSEGLLIIPSGKKLNVAPLSGNWGSTPRTWKITVMNEDGDIIYYINVTQKGYR